MTYGIVDRSRPFFNHVQNVVASTPVMNLFLTLGVFYQLLEGKSCSDKGDVHDSFHNRAEVVPSVSQKHHLVEFHPLLSLPLNVVLNDFALAHVPSALRAPMVELIWADGQVLPLEFCGVSVHPLKDIFQLVPLQDVGDKSRVGITGNNRVMVVCS